MRNLNKLTVIFLIAIPLLFAQSPGQGDRPIEPVIQQLKTFIQEGMRKTGVPGVAVAVVYLNQFVYLNGFCYRKVGSGAGVDSDTVFQLASL